MLKKQKKVVIPKGECIKSLKISRSYKDHNDFTLIAISIYTELKSTYMLSGCHICIEYVLI